MAHNIKMAMNDSTEPTFLGVRLKTKHFKSTKNGFRYQLTALASRHNVFCI